MQTSNCVKVVQLPRGPDLQGAPIDFVIRSHSDIILTWHKSVQNTTNISLLPIAEFVEFHEISYKIGKYSLCPLAKCVKLQQMKSKTVSH